ncbi:hypothetical protein [Streptomyces sp. UG1]|uniref:hypothetical protein n=1 Tax=Streptomyces sp. UG1 TaxID=3417652 RepID=UPI003CEB6CC9
MKPAVPRRAWAVWAAAGAVLEAVALTRGGRTLTATLQWLFGIKPRRWWMPLGVAAIVGFAVWLPVHLIGG